MKLFDYKFLILFGLTFVLYFIYKEVEYLRAKILKLESTLLNNKLIDNEIKNVQINERSNSSQGKLESTLSNIKRSFTLDNEPELFSLQDLLFPNFLPKTKIINVDLSKNDIVISESESSVSSKHVAIYSNDNEQYDDKTCSLLDKKESEELEEPEKDKEVKYDRESLMKLTLDKLRKMARDKNINLVKENGKQKIKKELIDNILE
jgi:hypothetical protein